jgi:hypothetical protein
VIGERRYAADLPSGSGRLITWIHGLLGYAKSYISSSFVLIFSCAISTTLYSSLLLSLLAPLRVGIATGWTTGFYSRWGQQIFLYFIASRLALEHTQPPIKRVLGAPSSEACSWQLPSLAEVKNGGTLPPLSSTSSCHSASDQQGPQLPPWHRLTVSSPQGAQWMKIEWPLLTVPTCESIHVHSYVHALPRSVSRWRIHLEYRLTVRVAMALSRVTADGELRSDPPQVPWNCMGLCVA